MAYDRISPIGYLRADWQAASIAAVVANGLSAKSKQYQPEDFLLHFGEKTRPLPDDVGRRTMAIFERIKKSRERKDGGNDRETGSQPDD